MRYRNLFGTGGVPVRTGNYNPISANPRHRKARRRNPDLNLGKWAKVDHLVDGVAIGTGFVVSEILARDLKMGYEVPKGGTIDPVKQVMDFLAHAGVGILGATVLDMAKQKEAGEKFAGGAFAAGVMKIIGNLHVLPETIIQSGSLIVGHREPTRIAAMPGAASGNIPGIRQTPYVPPVRTL